VGPDVVPSEYRNSGIRSAGAAEAELSALVQVSLKRAGGEHLESPAHRRRRFYLEIRFIEPGSPWQNGVNESFNGRFRDECLDRELLGSVLEAQVISRAFQTEYNTIRPHSTIGYKVPAEYRAELLRQAPGSGQARQAGPSLRPELASPSTNNDNYQGNQEPAQTLSSGGPRS
jgi:hypothetical protein